MRSGAAWIGNMPQPRICATRASTSPCCTIFASASGPCVGHRFLDTSDDLQSVGGSKHEARNGRILRMSWRRSGHSTAWNVP